MKHIPLAIGWLFLIIALTVAFFGLEETNSLITYHSNIICANIWFAVSAVIYKLED